MYPKKGVLFFVACGVMAVFLLGTCQSCFSATVTVNSTVAAAPGSIYNSCKDAADNLNTGDTWGDGNDDTILVTDDGVVIESDVVELSPFMAGSSITIRNNPGDSPIIALDPLSPPTRLFRIRQSATVTYEGLTCIGGDGVDAGAADIRGCFAMEADDVGEVVEVTIRNCVVTKNLGGDVPQLDYSAAQPADGVGAFRRAIYHGDDPYRGLMTCTVEDSVFAFIVPDYAAIQFDRQVAPENTNSPATRVLDVARTLITKIGNSGDGHGMRSRDVGSETTYTFTDCAFTDCRGRGLLFGVNDLTGIAPNINVIHTIISNTSDGSSPINIDVSGSNRFTGTLTVDQATLSRPGADLIVVEGGAAQDGDGNYSLTDVIAVDPHDSLFRWTLEDGTSGPGSLTVSNVATNAPYRGSQNPSIKAPFDADFGGAGPLTDDPTFVATTIDASFAGIRSWDSTTNDLFDVTNATFLGQGSGGTDLAGGAEHTLTTPPPTPTPTPTPPPSSSVENWEIY